MPMSLSTSDMTRIKRLSTTLTEPIFPVPPFQNQITVYPNTDPNNGSTGTVLNNTPTRAFVLGCIDPRYASALENYLANSLVADEFSYDLFILAGAAMGGNLTGNDSLLSCSTMPGGPTKCGIVSNTNNWNEVVKEHIQVGIALHDVKKLIVVDHLDCGAYKACVLCDLGQPDLTLSVHGTQYVKFTDDIKATNFFPHGSGSATPGSSIFSDGVTGACFDYRNPGSGATTTNLLTYDTPARIIDTDYFPNGYQTKVLVLGCIDPRYSQLLTSFLNNYKDVQFIYDLFILAGSSLGANQSYLTGQFPLKRAVGNSTGTDYPTNQLATGLTNTVGPMGVNWGPTFFDHLSIARFLHQVTEVWVFDHLDCGAYKAIKLGGLGTTDLLTGPHIEELQRLQVNINKYTSSSDPLSLNSAPYKLAFKGFIMDMQGGITKVVDDNEGIDFNPRKNPGSSRIRNPTSDYIDVIAKCSADYVLSRQIQTSPQGFSNQLVQTKLTPVLCETTVLQTKVGPLKSGLLNRNRL